MLTGTARMTAADTTSDRATLPVVVVGAGPVGLAAAAHLRAYGLTPLVLEAGDRVGAAILEWGHVRTFTPWRYIVDAAAEKLLAPTGWTRPEGDVPPTGAEIVRQYLEPLAAALGPYVATGARVVGVTRDGIDKARSLGREERAFAVRVRGADGDEADVLARAVIDASGTWDRPNPVGASGLPATGEMQAREAGFVAPALPDVLGADRARYAGRRTVVVGAGHSAANTLLSLAELARHEPGTELVWLVRGDAQRVYGGGDDDQLRDRGKLGSDLRDLVTAGAVEHVTGFSVTSLETAADGETVSVVGVAGGAERRVDGVHTVVAATGYRPDLSFLSEVRLELDPGLDAPARLAPLIDPAFHSCGTVPPHGHRDLAHPEPGFYLAGMKSYGRAPTFLITTGNEQVRSIVAAIAGDSKAADEVQLVLPETGVCSVDRSPAASGGCCG
jgi:thioredoxin reductase